MDQLVVESDVLELKGPVAQILVFKKLNLGSHVVFLDDDFGVLVHPDHPAQNAVPHFAFQMKNAKVKKISLVA